MIIWSKIPPFINYVHVIIKPPFSGYKALCDIDESHSCSSVFNSTYGRGFGIVGKLMGDDAHPLNVPNSIYGIAFYR